MKTPVRFYPRARRDFLEHILYLSEKATPAIASLFSDEVLSLTGKLLALPLRGRMFSSENPRLSKLRFFPVAPPFQKYLIFYEPAKNGINVVRILHGARDVASIL